MGKSIVNGRWGLRHLNFVFICRMATRLRLKLRIWVVLYIDQVVLGCSFSSSCRNFCSKWAVSFSQRLVTEAIGMQRQPWRNWTFLTKRNCLTTLEWSPTTMAVPFCFHVKVGLKLAAQRARAKQNRAIGNPWRRGDDGDDQVCVLGGARRSRGRDVREVWRRGRHWGRGWRVLWARRSVGRGVGRGRGRAQGRGRGLGRGIAVDRNASSVGNNEAQPLTRDVVNLGESESRESIPLREIDAHFQWYCKPEREFNFFKLFWVEQVPEAFFRIHEGVCDRRPNFEPQFGQHFILQNWWAWACLQFCITKKVTASKQKLVKSALFHILSAHGKGLNRKVQSIVVNYNEFKGWPWSCGEGFIGTWQKEIMAGTAHWICLWRQCWLFEGWRCSRLALMVEGLRVGVRAKWTFRTSVETPDPTVERWMSREVRGLLGTQHTLRKMTADRVEGGVLSFESNYGRGLPGPYERSGLSHVPAP